MDLHRAGGDNDHGLEHALCRYLTEEIYKKPVIVYNYPKDIKAFYMRLNDDGKTVAAMDVLVPKVRWICCCLFCASAIFLFAALPGN